MREVLADQLNKLIYEFIVLLASHSLMPPSLDEVSTKKQCEIGLTYNIEFVVEKLWIVGTDIQGNGKGMTWVNASDEPIMISETGRSQRKRLAYKSRPLQ